MAGVAEFAKKYRDRINSDPEFRWNFHKMTKEIGVDPLASNRGFWAELLGVGDFYYDLSVQIIDVCMTTREINGGMIEIEDLLTHLQRMRGQDDVAIKVNDIEQSVKTIQTLDENFSLKNIDGTVYVVSVPFELRPDHSTVLSLVSSGMKLEKASASITPSKIEQRLQWSRNRIAQTLHEMTRDGISWVDHQDDSGEYVYWFPTLMSELISI